jgi:hypothetical protein
VASTQKPFIPTIDQLMAWSPAFYPNLNGIRERSIVTGNDSGGLSFNYSNPAALNPAKSQKIAVQQNPLAFVRQAVSALNAKARSAKTNCRAGG